MRAEEGRVLEQQRIGQNMIRRLKRFIVLNTIDHAGTSLDDIDYLRQGRAPALDGAEGPCSSVSRRGEAMFQEMMDKVKAEVCSFLFHAEVAVETTSSPSQRVNRAGSSPTSTPITRR